MNEELFNLMAKYDFQRVNEYLEKGYTETSEFKNRIEALYSSLEALLQEMDRHGEK